MFFPSLQLNSRKTTLCCLMLKVTYFFWALNSRVSFVNVAGVGVVTCGIATIGRSLCCHSLSQDRGMTFLGADKSSFSLSSRRDRTSLEDPLTCHDSFLKKELKKISFATSRIAAPPSLLRHNVTSCSTSVIATSKRHKLCKVASYDATNYHKLQHCELLHYKL
jgi:hypothetical protein